MKLTETQARDVWCPLVDFVTPRDPKAAEYVAKITTNLADGTARPCCIASGCSQWRWVDAPTYRLENEEKYVSSDAVDYAGWIAQASRHGWTMTGQVNDQGWTLYTRGKRVPIEVGDRRGFCGQATVPFFEA